MVGHANCNGSFRTEAERKRSASTVKPDLGNSSGGKERFVNAHRNSVGAWRIVDIVVAAVLGVAVGIIFFAYNQIYEFGATPLKAFLPGLQALVTGLWLLGGPLGMLIIRKPGAGVFTELMAATVSAVLGAQWGWLTIEAGIVQGLAAELAFAFFLYRRFSLPVVLLSGVFAGAGMAVNDLVLWYPGSIPLFMVVYGVSAMVSGLFLAGVLGWLLTGALARTGVLNRFAAGRARSARV